jgi:hypothetical protein
MKNLTEAGKSFENDNVNQLNSIVELLIANK